METSHTQPSDSPLPQQYSRITIPGGASVRTFLSETTTATCQDSRRTSFTTPSSAMPRMEVATSRSDRTSHTLFTSPSSEGRE